MFWIGVSLLLCLFYIISVVWALIHVYLIYKHKLQDEKKHTVHILISFVPIINMTIESMWVELVQEYNWQAKRELRIDSDIMNHFKFDTEYLFLLPVALLILTFFI